MARAIGRRPQVTPLILNALRAELSATHAKASKQSREWSGAALSRYLVQAYGISLGPRQCRRVLATLADTKKPVRSRVHRRSLELPEHHAQWPRPLAFVSDALRKQTALRRIRRLCSSGLPLEPLVASLFDLIQEAVPNSDNKVLLADSGNNPSRYIINHPELALWTPIHKHYYIDSSPAISGMRVRFAQPDLSMLQNKRIWTSEELALPHYRDSEGYNEFLRPLGFDHMLLITFSDRGEAVGCYPLWRSVKMPSFTGEDVRFMELAGPHIAHGLKLASLLSIDSRVSVADFRADPEKPASVIILDEAGNVIAMDKDSESTFFELQLFDALGARATGARHSREIFNYIAALMHQIFSDSWRSSSEPDAPVIKLYSHRTGILLKLRGYVAQSSNGRRVFMVLVERGELRQHWRERMAITTGLSATDVAILDGLRNDLHPAQIAARMNLAAGTLKSYVRRLCEKLTPTGGLDALRRIARLSWS